MLATSAQTWQPGQMEKRKPYPSDVSDEESSFAAPYLTLISKDAPQPRYELREMFNALRWMARAGASWRTLPTNFPPQELVYHQTQRWIRAGCFEAMVSDLHSVIRVAQGRSGQPSAEFLTAPSQASSVPSEPRRKMQDSRVNVCQVPAIPTAAFWTLNAPTRKALTIVQVRLITMMGSRDGRCPIV